jgi:hypothetical protein
MSEEIHRGAGEDAEKIVMGLRNCVREIEAVSVSSLVSPFQGLDCDHHPHPSTHSVQAHAGSALCCVSTMRATAV